MLEDLECPARCDNQRKQTLQSRSAFTEKESGTGRKSVRRKGNRGAYRVLALNPQWIHRATRLLVERLVYSAVVEMVKESENLKFTISCLVALMKHESSIPVLAEGYDRRIFLNVPAQYYMGTFHRACPVFQFCCVSVNKDYAFYSFPLYWTF